MQKESHVELSLHEQDDCVVNNFSISLVSGLRAEAADPVTFYLCLWEPFTFHVDQKKGVSEFTFPDRATNLKLDRNRGSRLLQVFLLRKIFRITVNFFRAIATLPTTSKILLYPNGRDSSSHTENLKKTRHFLILQTCSDRT